MTERAEHTAGPWFVTRKREVGPRSDADDQSFGMVIGVCDVYGDNADADARLIAAAPDLLAALKVALPRLAHKASCHTVRPTSEWEKHGSACFDECDCEIKVVRAAISKATGEA